jgi:hypothetical protein
MSAVRLLVRDDRGASAAEFALVLPLLLLFLLGMIDVGRFMWEYNQAEKATQMGARFAVVTDVVLSDLSTYSFASDGGVAQGDPIPTTHFTSATCTNTACTCVASSGSFCSSPDFDGTAFNRIVERMRVMYPMIQPANVILEYRNVGLGYAGDPYGPDVAPLVTVRLTGMQFQPLTTLIFGGALTMPAFQAALTLEDGSNNSLTPPIAN